MQSSAVWGETKTFHRRDDFSDERWKAIKSWIAQNQSRIEHRKLGRSLNHRAFSVLVHVNGSGEVLDAHIIDTTGSGIWDTKAVHIVKKTAYLLPLPEHVLGVETFLLKYEDYPHCKIIHSEFSSHYDFGAEHWDYVPGHGLVQNDRL